MGINDSDSAAGTYMKPCEALPMRAKMTADKTKKELWCDLKDGDNRESVTIPCHGKSIDKMSIREEP